MAIYIRVLVVVLVLMSRGGAFAATEAVGNAPKLPTPDAVAFERATKMVKEIFKEDLAKARTAGERVGVAKKLLAAGVEERKDAAGRYALLALARDVAAEAGYAEGAMSAVDELDRSYHIDAIVMRAEALAATAKAATSPAAVRELVERAVGVVDQAVRADRYDVAKRVADLAVAWARKAGDASLLAAASGRVREVVAGERASRDAAQAAVILEKNPTDPDANLRVGSFRCFVKGDWERGVPMLALGSDPALKALAGRELLGAADAEARLALGDAWWDLAQQDKGGGQRPAARARAGQWYAEALPGMSGLTRAKVEKRLGEIAAGRQLDHPIASDANKVNLLATVDPVRHAVAGKWTVREGALVAEKDNGPVRIEFPYEPPEEYDVSVRVTRLDGDADIMMGLCKGGRPFLFCLAVGKDGEYCQFGPINGAWGGIVTAVNPSRGKVTIRSGQRYECTVKVRNDGLEAYLDGKPVCRWKTDYRDMSKPGMYPVRNASVLAVGGYKSSVAFDLVTVTEVSGAGKRLEGPWK